MAHRTAAQRAATRRTIAANKAARRAGKKRKSGKRRAKGTRKMSAAVKRQLRAAARAAKKVVRSIASSGRKNKRAPKRARHGKAHPVFAKNLGARVRNLEVRMQRTEKNVKGMEVWAGHMQHAVLGIYRATGHRLPGGSHRALGSGGR